MINFDNATCVLYAYQKLVKVQLTTKTNPIYHDEDKNTDESARFRESIFAYIQEFQCPVRCLFNGH